MSPLSAREVRRSFLRYFESHAHAVIKSSSLLPEKDPTLMFTNAGMNQFKLVFTGRETRPYTRATSSQKCMRVSGKHNDLENVGRTPRHHTFFEMLGNFSFGDYFKREAIRFGWEWLTSAEQGLGLDPGMLWVTTYAPDPGEDFDADDEAADLWLNEFAFVPPERHRTYGKSENFWSMGETGPCGPCSEIHLDYGGTCRLGKTDDECGPACDCGRFVELWNLVFMQFNVAEPGGKAEPLPAPCVDTGAGLERCVAAVQGVRTNYETDLFTSLTARGAEIAGLTLGDDEEQDVSLRVIADHARATAFLIADGVQPSNEGRGYVLRRIMRRAIRHGHKLGIADLFLFDVVEAVVDEMGQDYPELLEQRQFVHEVARGEERTFRETLARGIRIFNEGVTGLERGRTVSGDLVFTLKDTYGFPEDLTRVMAAERGLSTDEAGFARLLEEQRARAGTDGIGEAGVADVYHAVRERVGATEFLGYTGESASGTLLALLRREEGGWVETERAAAGDGVELVLDRTTFYGESGGQVGDRGTMAGGDAEIEIADTQRPLNDLFVHRGTVRTGELALGARLELNVDGARRSAIRQHHSATHLMHRALRQVLGDHVRQKGSVVEPDRFRFDYAQYEAPTREQLAEVERRINEMVQANLEVTTEVLGFDEAKQRGAIALFEEKYGDTVRMVSMGGSTELCGGTHVHRTGDIGAVVLLQDSALAAGVRRIEAAAGEAAVAEMQGRWQALKRAAEFLRTDDRSVPAAVERLHAERKAAEKEIERLTRKLAAAQSAGAADAVEEIDGLKLLVVRSEAADPKTLRDYGDKLRDRIGSGLVVTGGTDGNKVFLLAMATADVAGERVHAGKIIKALCEVVGGRGGGRPEMAQGGGSDPSKLDEALAQVKELVQR